MSLLEAILGYYRDRARNGVDACVCGCLGAAADLIAGDLSAAIRLVSYGTAVGLYKTSEVQADVMLRWLRTVPPPPSPPGSVVITYNSPVPDEDIGRKP